MMFHILAVGKMNASPELDLVNRYRERLGGKLKITEIAEGRAFPAAPPSSVTLVMDERGDTLTSEALAQRIERWQMQAVREIRFLIGGADGHGDDVRKNADLLFAFGPATWPHMLLRAMLAEQIYRAQMILAGHPYHRSG
jgi:23S rRNA (pseudouridine1915-N3)-methyltransferase